MVYDKQYSLRSESGSNKPSASGILKSPANCLSAPVCRLNWERNLFRAHSNSWQNSFSVASRAETQASYQLTAESAEWSHCVCLQSIASHWNSNSESAGKASLYYVTWSQEGHLTTLIIGYSYKQAMKPVYIQGWASGSRDHWELTWSLRAIYSELWMNEHGRK